VGLWVTEEREETERRTLSFLSTVVEEAGRGSYFSDKYPANSQFIEFVNSIIFMPGKSSSKRSS
jgi:hypothetical protein